MKRAVQLTEVELNDIIKKVVNEQIQASEDSESSYRSYEEHWKNKFEKSVQILLEIGYKPDDLIGKIKSMLTSDVIKEQEHSDGKYLKRKGMWYEFRQDGDNRPLYFLVDSDDKDIRYFVVLDENFDRYTPYNEEKEVFKKIIKNELGQKNKL